MIYIIQHNYDKSYIVTNVSGCGGPTEYTKNILKAKRFSSEQEAKNYVDGDPAHWVAQIIYLKIHPKNLE